MNARPSAPRAPRTPRTLVVCAGLALATAAHAREAPQAINPSALPPAHGYSHVIVAPPGRMVSISGQVAMDRGGKLVGEGDFRARCVQVFENLRIALNSAGLDFRDVVRTDMYVTDLDHLDVLRDVRAHYLPADAPATSTLVKVDALFRPGLMIEVAAEAVLPPGRTPHR
ncbi:RidA family protein [Frateuria soli]|uniref:RidA family protein n=1 Tax=Frateuria soli TaxID=1542730 RepID=UPI001E402654|nr:RidA family protein [Frateuria soli]UGB38636.1 RidA family protein [Frateuria soli]